MDTRFCCDCGVLLVKPTAKFCPKGHSQTNDIAANKDRHPDDDDDDDDDVFQIVGGALFDPQPALRSALPVVAAQQLRSKAVQKDANTKKTDKIQGAFGIRPANESAIRKTIVIWLCDRPPIKPQQRGISLVKKIEYSTRLDTAQSVDSFVRSVVLGFPAFQEHIDISSGELSIDDSRLAYIGKIEGNSCAWSKVWEEL
jgi:hypothetical protein